MSFHFLNDDCISVNMLICLTRVRCVLIGYSVQGRQSVFIGCVVFSIIVAVRETCADWLRGIEPQDDPALRGKKDDDSFHMKVPRRNVGPSSTQVILCTCILWRASFLVNVDVTKIESCEVM